MIEFEVIGKIVGKQRPRFNMYTKRTYTPSKTKNYEDMISYSFYNKYKKFKPLSSNLEVHLIFYFEIPKSYTKKQRLEIQNGTVRPNKKPDIDNCIKSVLDALNKVAYNDDTQILKIIAEKKYTFEQEKVNIIIKEIEE